MSKTLWTYIVIAIAVAGAGGVAYYVTRESRHVDPPAVAVQPAPIVENSQPQASNDEEVKRKTIEGIGSIKNLKPVPLQPSQQR